MRRTLATLAVVGALLLSAGATLADDTSEANELFVEAAKLVKSVEAVVLEEVLGKDNVDEMISAAMKGHEPHILALLGGTDPGEKAVVLEEALGKLNEIVEDYPSTDLAVKLISGQNIGAISLEGVTAAVEYYRMLEKPPEPNTPVFNYLLASVVDAPVKPPEPKMPEVNKLLASVADAPPTTPDIKEKQQTRTSTMDMALANQVAKVIKSKVEKNWSVPAGVRDAGQQIVTIRIRLGRDGAVQSTDILDDNYANDANFRTMAESARRAVLKASPFPSLKRFSDDYDQWRDVTMIFRPPV
jgi:hypothetical protein